MVLHYAKITSKSQTTLPLAVRKALNVSPGDTLVYRVSADGVTLSRAEPMDPAYLRGLDATLSEWGTAEDAAAYDDL